jgi:hypothetical protein
VLVGSATDAAATTIAVGVLSYDEFTQGGTAAINLANLTGDPLSGGFSLAPAFPVISSVLFATMTLTVTDDQGTDTILDLGDLAPGLFLDGDGFPPTLVQFPLAASIASVRLAASISVGPWLLDDGSQFTPLSAQIEAELLPSAGAALGLGDFTVLTVDGVVEATPVPEPSTLAPLLVATAIFACGWPFARPLRIRG